MEVIGRNAWSDGLFLGRTGSGRAGRVGWHVPLGLVGGGLKSAILVRLGLLVRMVSLIRIVRM